MPKATAAYRQEKKSLVAYLAPAVGAWSMKLALCLRRLAEE